MSGANADIIVADIGGTHARFATVSVADNSLEINHRWRVESANFGSLSQALDSYMATLPTRDYKACCLAVAGPVTGDQVTLTNLGWQASISQMQAQFTFEKFDLINDFSALSYSLPYLDSSLVSSIHQGKRVMPGAARQTLKTIVGPGTGFGVSSLVSIDGKWSLIDGEGGHASFAPTTPLELEILRVLMQRFDRVSIEALSSGAGLMNIYQALATIRDEHAQALAPKQIAALGGDGADALCEQTLHTFCAILGSVAGDIALLNLPTGGLYLGGGILPKIEGVFRKSDFLPRFFDKAPMAHLLADIPIDLIVSDDAAFIGAAAAIR